MTNFKTRMIVAAATVLAAAATASAQTLKVEIPFPFRVASKVMAAGTYSVIDIDRRSGNPIFLLRDSHQDDAVVIKPVAGADPPKAWTATGEPLVSFACAGGPCVLSGIWTGPLKPMYKFRSPLGKDAPARMAVLTMRPARGM